MELLECLAAQLPSLPDPSLFADVGSAPAAPGDAAQAAAWSAAAAAHLQLLAELVARLDAVALGMEALAASGSSQAGSEAPGSLRIEELDAAAPTSRLPATLVLAAALFGSSDPQLQPLRPWAAEPAAAAAQQLLVALAGKLAAVLEQRRREVQPSAQPGVLLQEVSTTLSTTSKAASGPQPQPEAVQQLLALALPPAVQQLRPVVAAKVEHAKHKTARLEPYTGACISLLFSFVHRVLLCAQFGCGMLCVLRFLACASVTFSTTVPSPPSRWPPSEGGGRHFLLRPCCGTLHARLPSAAPPLLHSPLPSLLPAGPGDFERCVAAGQLAWLLRQLSGLQLSAAGTAALLLLLMASEDPFPPVQACALWSLQHIAAAGQAGDLK